VVAGDSPLERRAQVLVLGLHPAQPGHLLAAVQFLLGLLREGEEPLDVPRARAVDLPHLAQSVPGILPGGFEQPVAAIVFAVFHDHERFVDQVRQKVEDVGSSDAFSRASRLRRLQREAPGKHRQPPEGRFFGLGQRLETPIQSTLQRLMPRQGGAAAPGEQAKLVVQAGGDLLR